MSYIDHILKIKKCREILDVEYPVFEELEEETNALINSVETLAKRNIFITQESKKILLKKIEKYETIKKRIEDIVNEGEKEVSLAKGNGYDINMDSIYSFSKLLKNSLKDKNITVKELSIELGFEEIEVKQIISFGCTISQEIFDKIIKYFNLEEIQDLYTNIIYVE